MHDALLTVTWRRAADSFAFNGGATMVMTNAASVSEAMMGSVDDDAGAGLFVLGGGISAQ